MLHMWMNGWTNKPNQTNLWPPRCFTRRLKNPTQYDSQLPYCKTSGKNVWFEASAVVQMRSVLFWEFTRCRMVLGKRPAWRTILFYIFISILYVFRATPWSSSGESIVSIQPLVYATLCRWLFHVQAGKFPSDLHTKHVENWNKYIEKKCASSWSCTKNHNEMHGQQNIKFYRMAVYYWCFSPLKKYLGGHRSYNIAEVQRSCLTMIPFAHPRILYWRNTFTHNTLWQIPEPSGWLCENVGHCSVFLREMLLWGGGKWLKKQTFTT